MRDEVVGECLKKMSNIQQGMSTHEAEGLFKVQGLKFKVEGLYWRCQSLNLERWTLNFKLFKPFVVESG